MSENGSVGCEGVGDTGTLRVEAALRHDIGSSVDPDPDEIRILPKRRGSCTSTRSWSSGKTRKAPPPPTTAPVPQQPPDQLCAQDFEVVQGGLSSADEEEVYPEYEGSDFSEDSQASSYPPTPTKNRSEFSAGCREGLEMFCQDQWTELKTNKRKQRSCSMWSCFTIFILAVVIALAVLITNIQASFSTNTTRGPPEKIIDGRDSVDLDGGTRVLDVMFVLGGNRWNSQMVTKVDTLTKKGLCNLPHQYPAPLPIGLIGAMSVYSSDLRAVVICGGLSSRKPTVLNPMCYKYHLTTHQWQQIKPRIPLTTAFGSAILTPSNQMVISGGNFKSDILGSTQIIDLNSNKWSLGSSLPYGMWGHCMVSLPNGDTVVIGGWPDKNQLLRVTGMRSVWRTGSVTDGGHWQPWPSLNHPRATHSCIVTKYKHSSTAILVVGGLGVNGTALNSIEILELSDQDYQPLFQGSGSWEVMRHHLNEPRAYYPSLSVLNGRLIVAGGKKGKSKSNEDLASMETYSKKKGWVLSNQGGLSTPRSGATSVTVKVNNPDTSIFQNCPS